MNKINILNILLVIILLAGSAMIILAFFKPMRLMGSSKRYSSIKDKQGFIKASQKLYVLSGVVWVGMSILSLLEIINLTIFFVTVSLTSSIVTLINSGLIKKYERKTFL